MNYFMFIIFGSLALIYGILYVIAGKKKERINYELYYDYFKYKYCMKKMFLIYFVISIVLAGLSLNNSSISRLSISIIFPAQLIFYVIGYARINNKYGIHK